MQTLRHSLQRLYEGDSKHARRFRYGLFAFDVFVILSFLVESIVIGAGWAGVLNYALLMPLTLDFCVRVFIAARPRGLLLSPVTWTDLVVIVTLLLPVLEDLAFLRVLRIYRMFHSFRFQRTLRADSAFFKRNEEIVESVLNLLLFIFVVSAVVFVLQKDRNEEIGTYIDALYYTVTTLTTTGFGDVVLEGNGGRLLAVLIMVLGFGLFLRLVQTIVRPAKVAYRCRTCGLSRHDHDAVCCKACGNSLNIETTGE